MLCMVGLCLLRMGLGFYTGIMLKLLFESWPCSGWLLGLDFVGFSSLYSIGGGKFNLLCPMLTIFVWMVQNYLASNQMPCAGIP